jgi:enoyl-CoA hydratase/carnithine racemase
MSKVLIENRGNIGILRLNNGKTNAINSQMVNDLYESLASIKTRYKGMVLAGGEKFFSIGLDLPELLRLDKTGMSNFMHGFNQIAFDIFTLPIPSVCAISGHAIAGGNVLALTCDFRFGTSDKKKIGLNEIKLGLPVPYIADLILRQIAGERASTEMLYHGEFMSLLEAKKIGLIDNICSPETVEDQAVNKATELAASHGQAFATLKANRIEVIRSRYEENCESKNNIFIECWFSDPVQKLLKKASHKF